MRPGSRVAPASISPLAAERSPFAEGSPQLDPDAQQGVPGSLSPLARQPLKGIVFTALSVLLAAGLWFLLHGAFGLTYASSSVVITVCFSWFWQLAWSFGGWPGNRVTANRWLRGTLNWVLLMAMVWLTVELWHWFYGKPFAETDIGLWGQTAILAGVISLFFFGNRLLLGDEQAERQPLSGFVNLVWALFLLPFALLLLPTLGGGHGFYVPWIWFPITLVVMGYFGGWPFSEIEQPRAGIVYMGTVLAGTVGFLAVLKVAGTDFFSSGAGAEEAAIFGATWTNVGFVYAWLGNQWPIGDLPQPLKGILGTIGTLVVSGAIYALLRNSFSIGQLPAVVFGEFALMWALVSFAGIGLFNVFEWGYEDDPGGANIGLGKRFARVPRTAEQAPSPAPAGALAANAGTGGLIVETRANAHQDAGAARWRSVSVFSGEAGAPLRGGIDTGFGKPPGGVRSATSEALISRADRRRS